MESLRPEPDDTAHATDEELLKALAVVRSALKSDIRSGRTALQHLTRLEHELRARIDKAPGGTADD